MSVAGEIVAIDSPKINGSIRFTKTKNQQLFARIGLARGRSVLKKDCSGVRFVRSCSQHKRAIYKNLWRSMLGHFLFDTFYVNEFNGLSPSPPHPPARAFLHAGIGHYAFQNSSAVFPSA